MFFVWRQKIKKTPDVRFGFWFWNIEQIYSFFHFGITNELQIVQLYPDQ